MSGLFVLQRKFLDAGFPMAFEHLAVPAARADFLAKEIGANSYGYDQWGVHLPTLLKVMPAARFMYRHYFRVRAFGLQNIPDGPVMVVPNHSGQLPLDGMLIATAFLYEAETPRLLRSMIERWFPTVPFLGSFMQRCGQIVGEPSNCERLLRGGQSIQVFPEGARGGGKTWWQRYQLQRFGTGFMRLALQTGTPIIPTAVIGCEETYPSLVNLEPVAKMLGTPYFPVFPQMLLGPLAGAPLPARVDLYFGEPLTFDDAVTSDADIVANVDVVKEHIGDLIARGLQNQRA